MSIVLSALAGSSSSLGGVALGAAVAARSRSNMRVGDRIRKRQKEEFGVNCANSRRTTERERCSDGFDWGSPARLTEPIWPSMVTVNAVDQVPL